MHRFAKNVFKYAGAPVNVTYYYWISVNEYLCEYLCSALCIVHKYHWEVENKLEMFEFCIIDNKYILYAKNEGQFKKITDKNSEFNANTS